MHGASIRTRSIEPFRSSRVSVAPRGVRTCTLRTPARSSRAWIGDKAALVGVGREDLARVLHHRRQRQRLAAAARAKVDHLLAGLGTGEQRRQLRAFILDFNAALDEDGLGLDRRAFSARATR